MLGPGGKVIEVIDLKLHAQTTVAYHLYGVSSCLTLYHTKRLRLTRIAREMFVRYLLEVDGSLRHPLLVK